MIDVKNHTRLQVDYSIDNITWNELIDTDQFERPMNRFGQTIPTKLIRQFVKNLNSLNFSYLRNILVQF